MDKIRLVLFLGVAAAAAAHSAAEVPRTLRFMTFNIYGAGYGGFKAEEREDRAVAVVRGRSPDIVSWQEVNSRGQALGRTSFLPRFCHVLRRYLPRNK